MKGDFTRDTFDPAKHFSSVLMQQGRVMLDADYNEQSAILLHYIRTLARDLIGPYAAPFGNAGFELAPDPEGGFSISAGRYYVDGILVENEVKCPYAAQPHYQLPPDDEVLKESKNKSGQIFWAYLDVWERHITSLEDDSIREKALDGPDTCTRSKVVWQVKVLPIKTADGILDLEGNGNKLAPQPETANPENAPAIENIDESNAIRGTRQKFKLRCESPLDGLLPLSRARMAARVDPGYKYEDPCVTSPDSKYRGPENHLYRVEIHQGTDADTVTFKWSRDNGSNAAAWLGTSGDDGNEIEVASTRGFTAGGWIELTDDTLDLAGEPGTLVKIAKIEGARLVIDPDNVPATGAPLAWSKQLINPRVRHWNQTRRGDIKEGAVPLIETSAKAERWIDLEDGIQVRFEAGGEYRTGDYWLIPARVATGKLEWPNTLTAGKEVPDLLGPKGIEHHYAPLGFLSWNEKADNNTKSTFRSCRCDFDPLSSCFTRKNIDAQPPVKDTEMAKDVSVPAGKKRARAQKKSTP
jgi:hypothetical protein